MHHGRGCTDALTGALKPHAHLVHFPYLRQSATALWMGHEGRVEICSRTHLGKKLMTFQRALAIPLIGPRRPCCFGCAHQQVLPGVHLAQLTSGYRLPQQHKIPGLSCGWPRVTCSGCAVGILHFCVLQPSVKQGQDASLCGVWLCALAQHWASTC